MAISISLLWESFLLPPKMLSMIVAGDLAGIVAFGNEGIKPRMARSCDLNWDIVGQPSIVQCPELWGLGAISFRTNSSICVSQCQHASATS